MHRFSSCLTSTHTIASAAKKYIQPYLHKGFAWTKQSHTKSRQNNLHSVHARPCNIYKQSGSKNTQQSTTHGNAPKGSGSYLRLAYSTHIHNISVHAHKPLQIINALTATWWDKQKETLMATYKPVMRPSLEYASSMWLPLASWTSINKLQVMQNAALRTAIWCTQRHKHTSAWRNTHTSHTRAPTVPRLIIQTENTTSITSSTQTHNILQHSKDKKHNFNNGRYTINIPTDTVTTTDIKTNMRHIHTSIVSRHLATKGNNKILRTPPPHIISAEELIPRLTRRTPAQLRTNKSPFLKSYLHKVNAKSHPSLTMPPLQHPHTWTHTISSTSPTYAPHCHPWICGLTRWSGGAADQMER